MGLYSDVSLGGGGKHKSNGLSRNRLKAIFEVIDQQKENRKKLEK